MTNFSRALRYAAIITIAGIGCSALADQAPAFASITCTNTVSHTPMQIRIDFAKHMVNADRAQIGAAEISWHADKENANYTLNRKTGMLEAVIPSSTGGYFLHYQCDLHL